MPEISIAPRMVTNFALIKPSFKKDLEDTEVKAPVSFLSELCTNLHNTCWYNISTINALSHVSSTYIFTCY